MEVVWLKIMEDEFLQQFIQKLENLHLKRFLLFFMLDENLVEEVIRFLGDFIEYDLQ